MPLVMLATSGGRWLPALRCDNDGKAVEITGRVMWNAADRSVGASVLYACRDICELELRSKFNSVPEWGSLEVPMYLMGLTLGARCGQILTKVLPDANVAMLIFGIERIDDLDDPTGGAL